jgi:hypothetical protein
MPTTQIQELSTRLLADEQFRREFKSAPVEAVRSTGIGLDDEELAALQQVDWAGMSDDELVVRVRGAHARATTMTA